MYLIVIAWLYVTLLMALAEAFSSQGSVLGALITFVFYGLLPMGLVVYLVGTPLRRRDIQRREQQNRQQSTPSAVKPDGGSHATGLTEEPTVAAVRKET